MGWKQLPSRFHPPISINQTQPLKHQVQSDQQNKIGDKKVIKSSNTEVREEK